MATPVATGAASGPATAARRGQTAACAPRGSCRAASWRRTATVWFSISKVSSAGSASPNWDRGRFRWNSAATTWGSLVDIDLSVLRSLESEKDISIDLVIKAIEDALLVAYHRTEGAAPVARAELDRKSGRVTVWAAHTGPHPHGIPEHADT